MTALIYFLIMVTVLAFLVTLWAFFKFFASFSSLNGAASQTAKRDMPADLYVTGGVVSSWRVLRAKNNATASRAFGNHLLILIVSFAVTMGAAGLFITLNAKHCVVPMSKQTNGGPIEQVCPAK